MSIQRIFLFILLLKLISIHVLFSSSALAGAYEIKKVMRSKKRAIIRMDEGQWVIEGDKLLLINSSGRCMVRVLKTKLRKAMVSPRGCSFPVQTGDRVIDESEDAFDEYDDLSSYGYVDQDEEELSKYSEDNRIVPKKPTEIDESKHIALKLSWNRRWFDIESDEGKSQFDKQFRESTEAFSDIYTIAARAAPISKTPVSLGLSYARISHTAGVIPFRLEVKGREWGVELFAWLPSVSGDKAQVSFKCRITGRKCIKNSAPGARAWVKFKYIFSGEMGLGLLVGKYTGLEATVGTRVLSLSSAALYFEAGYQKLYNENNNQQSDNSEERDWLLDLMLGAKYDLNRHAAIFLEGGYGWSGKDSFTSLALGVEGRI